MVEDEHLSRHNVLLKLDQLREIRGLLLRQLFCFCTLVFATLVVDHLIRQGKMESFTELTE